MNRRPNRIDLVLPAFARFLESSNALGAYPNTREQKVGRLSSPFPVVEVADFDDRNIASRSIAGCSSMRHCVHPPSRRLYIAVYTPLNLFLPRPT